MRAAAAAAAAAIAAEVTEAKAAAASDAPAHALDERRRHAQTLLSSWRGAGGVEAYGTPERRKSSSHLARSEEQKSIIC